MWRRCEIRSSSVASGPAYLDENGPGSPHKASTSSPESSASVVTPLRREYDIALRAAFSSKVDPVSGIFSLISASTNEITRKGQSDKIDSNSRNLPLLVVAMSRLGFIFSNCLRTRLICGDLHLHLFAVSPLTRCTCKACPVYESTLCVLDVCC